MLSEILRALNKSIITVSNIIMIAIFISLILSFL